MENKYYTPSLEEFHFGFEYEIEGFRGHEGFTPQRLDNMGQFSTITSFLDREPNRIRIKCLDTHDLEELGLRGVADEMNSGNYRVVSELYYGNNITEDEGLHVRAVLVNPNEIQIQSLHIDYYSCITNKYTPLFSGVLLNKSELKRLLSQISIINQKNK